jgi:hypothetical protein
MLIFPSASTARSACHTEVAGIVRNYRLLIQLVGMLCIAKQPVTRWRSLPVRRRSGAAARNRFDRDPIEREEV